MIDSKSELVEEIIQSFILDQKELYEEIDWWSYDEECAFNIHNYNSDDVSSFKVDVYPYAEGTDKPTYSTWTTVKTFNFNDYKKGDMI